ncbi:hypothetical protein NUU61_007516, partial [Penicillium alfredii]
ATAILHRADIPTSRLDPRSWTYGIPSDAQNRTSIARFNLQVSNTLSTEDRLSLDAPQVDVINGSVFDWWYFDAVSDTNSRESLVVTFFTSSAVAFPFLDATESSIFIAYLWASFTNGSTFAAFVPATVATVSGRHGARTPSSGQWASTGFSWTAPKEDLSQYEVRIASGKMQVEGRFTSTAHVPPQLPCGIHPGRNSLEVAPHIGWVNLIPDAMGVVIMTIRGSSLQFRGPAYHDKNCYLVLDDPTSTTYISSYVAKDGKVLVSSCKPSLLTVRPVGKPWTTGERYPPRVVDMPDKFRLEFDLGQANEWLRINVSMETLVAGDNEYYMRWTGALTGEIVRLESESSQEAGAVTRVRDHVGAGSATKNFSLAGVAVLEPFAMVP